MRVIIIQHVDFEGPAAIAEFLVKEGHELNYLLLYEKTDFPPLEEFEALVIMGGPMSIYDDDEFPWLIAERTFIQQSIAANKIVLGICLGAQFIADALGAKVYKGNGSEIGWFPLKTSKKISWLDQNGIYLDGATVFHWHSDTFDIPRNCEQLASSEKYPNQAFIYRNRVLALQFHLEVNPISMDRMIEAGMNHLTAFESVQSIEQIKEGYKYIESCNVLLIHLLKAIFNN